MRSALEQMIATIDLGLSKEEMAELTWEVQDKNRPFEVDLKKEMVTVTGKRNKTRQIPILPAYTWGTILETHLWL